MQQPEATPFKWSFSQWETYTQCPAKWKFGSVLKFAKLPPGPAAARGLEIHDSVEQYILGAPVSTLHGAIKSKFIPIFEEIKNHENGDRYCEKKLGFDSDWAVCAPTQTNRACVAILDAVRFTNDGTAVVYEWKSGKPKDTHADQRKLYALSSFLHWKAKRAEVTTYYLEDTGAPQRTVIEAKGAETLKSLWNTRTTQMQRDEFCAPRPSYGCNWCDFSKKKGGPCRFVG